MKKFFVSIVPVLLVSFFLSACGGGSGGGAAPTPSITSFSASASSIPAGTSVNLTAVFADGSGTIDNGVGAVTSGTAIAVTPATTTTYTLTVADTSGNSVTSSVTVTVTTPSITSFNASAASIPSGTSVNLTAVFADGTGTIDNGVGAVTSGTAVAVTLTTTTTFTLTVADTGGNSVSSTVTVVVTTPSITSFTASAISIPANSSVNLTAVFADGTGSIDNGVGAVTSGTPVAVTLTADTTFTLTVLDAGGNSVTAQVTVLVTTPSITSFTTSATTIPFGASVNLTATFADGTGSIDNGVGAVTSMTPVSVSPATTTTYTLTVTDGVNTVTSTVTVTVTLPTISSFTASALTIPAGASVTLSPVYSNGTGVIDNGGGAVASGGSVTLTPGSTTTYTLTVTDANSNTATATVTVTLLSLTSLSMTNGVLDQAFQETQNAYTASVGYLAKAVKLNATTANVGATITVAGVALKSDGSSHYVPLSEGVNSAINIVVTAADSTTNTYTLTVTRQLAASFAQQAYVKAANAGNNDKFGYSVALSGNTLAVGAYHESSSTTGVDSTPDNTASDAGAVYIFTRNGTVWSQEAYIKASNTDAFDEFGYSVALDGDTLVVGAILEDGNTTGVSNGGTGDISNLAPNSGAAYVFTRTGTTWTQQAYLKASNTDQTFGGDRFGQSVAVDGDTIAVGANYESSSATGVNGDGSDNADTNTLYNQSGAVYVFKRTGTSWAQEAFVKASNTGAFDYFGFSVSLDGDTLAVGASREETSANGIDPVQDNLAAQAGAVYVFTRNVTTWTQQAFIKAHNTGAQANFGTAVAVSDDTLAVGASRENSTATESGAAYVFTRSGTTWTQQAFIKASNAEMTDLFGISIGLSGDTLAVGAYLEDGGVGGIGTSDTLNATSASGAAYVFTRSGTVWTEQSYVKASNVDVADFYGYSVAVDGDTLAVGSPQEDGNALSTAASPNNGAGDAGAVYIFQ